MLLTNHFNIIQIKCVGVNFPCLTHSGQILHIQISESWWAFSSALLADETSFHFCPYMYSCFNELLSLRLLVAVGRVCDSDPAFHSFITALQLASNRFHLWSVQPSTRNHPTASTAQNQTSNSWAEIQQPAQFEGCWVAQLLDKLEK